MRCHPTIYDNINAVLERVELDEQNPDDPNVRKEDWEYVPVSLSIQSFVTAAMKHTDFYGTVRRIFERLALFDKICGSQNSQIL